MLHQQRSGFIRLVALLTPCLLAACSTTTPFKALNVAQTMAPMEPSKTRSSTPAPEPSVRTFEPAVWAFEPGVWEYPAGPRFAQEAQAAPQEALGNQPAPQASGGTDPDEWNFDLALYLWAAGVDGVASAGGVGVPINTSFGDLVDELQLGGMLAFGGKKGQWGFLLDGIYMDLGGSSSSPLGGDIDTDIEALIAEADITFSPMSSPNLDFIAGVRVLAVDQKIDFPIAPTVSGDDTLVDPVIGAQGTFDLGEEWKFRLRADVGGFGVSSELTYQFLGFFRYQFAEAWGLDFGYRLIGYDIKNSDVDLDAQFHGLIVGVDYAF